MSKDGKEKKKLWTYARENNVIGLRDSDGIILEKRWDKVSDEERMSVTKFWRGQYNRFYYEMDIGDIVLVMDGEKKLYGVAEVRGRPRLIKNDKIDEEFYPHIRNVKWLIAYDEPIDFRLPKGTKFRGTLLKITPQDKPWKLTNYDIREPLKNLKVKPAADAKLLRRKYGQRGESEEHKKLKILYANHPERLGLENCSGKSEYPFDTQDVADIVYFRGKEPIAVAEVETNVGDPYVGALQALKYRILLCAKYAINITSKKISAYLICTKQPNGKTKKLCKRYGIRVKLHNVA